MPVEPTMDSMIGTQPTIQSGIDTNVNKDFGRLDDAQQENVQVIEEKMTWGTISLESDDLRNRAWRAVMDRYWAVQPQHDEAVDLFDKYEQMWKIGSVDKKKDTFANIGSIDPWNAVEDWTSSIMDTIFSVDPPIEIRGKKQKLPNETKSRIRRVLMLNWSATNGEEEAENGLREGVKLGTFSFKTPYLLDEQPRLIVKTRPKTFNIGGMQIPTMQTEKFVEQEIEVEDRPALKHVDIRKLYFRYDKPIYKSWVIEEILDTWSNVEHQASKYNLYANLERAKGIAYPSEQESDRALKEGNKISSQPNQAANIETLDGDVMLYEAHNIPMTFKSDDPVPEELQGKRVLCIVTIANRMEVIRIQPTSFREPPYIIEPFFKQSGSALGMGVCQIIEYLVEEYNTRKNQTLDANTFGLYCMIAANMRYVKKKDQLKIRQNGLIELKDLPAGAKVSDVVDFIRPPVEFAQFAEIQMRTLRDDIQTATRLKSGVAGNMSQKGRRTATEMANLAKEAIKSVKMLLNRIDRNIFRKFFERSYTMSILNRQNTWMLEMQKQVPVIDPLTLKPQIDPNTGQPKMKPEIQWEEVSPEQIYTDGVDIDMLGTPHMQDEMVFSHKLMQVIDLASKVVPSPVMNEDGQLVLFDMYKAYNDILYAMDFEDPKSYWKAVPAQQILDQMQQNKPGGRDGVKAPGSPSKTGIQNKPPQASNIQKSAVQGAV